MQIESLQALLETLPDTKQPYRYPLSGVLTTICLGILCGYNEVRAIARWAQAYRWELPQRLGFPREKMPSLSTFQEALRRVDVDAFEALVARWGDSILRAHGHAGLQGVAIDGKTLRGSRTDEVPAVHLLSAFAHELHLVIGQTAVEHKTNEIGEINTLLMDLALEGRVVTVDALLTQRAIAEQIREKGGTM